MVVYILAALLHGSAEFHLVFAGSLDESSDRDCTDGSSSCDDVAVVAFFFNFKFL